MVFANIVHADPLSRRAMFVSVIQNTPTLSNREDIKELLRFSKQARIDTLFVQIYRANKAWFPSQYADSEPYQMCLKSVGEDPLALLIHEAHKEGIEVHAWLNLLSLSKNTNAPILKKYGKKILTRNTARKWTIADYKIDNQYFLEPGDSDVRAELADIVEEIVGTYPDLDYIRYPDSKPHYGYTDENVKRFKKSTGLKAIDDQSEIWQKWKRDQVTELLTQLIDKARAIHPGIQVSTTGCASYSRAYYEAFQDWPSWQNTGLVDFVTIMSYPDNLPEFQKHIAEARMKVTDFTKLNIAVGAYKFIHQPETFTDQFRFCEASGSRSCVVFHYGDLLTAPALKESLK